MGFSSISFVREWCGLGDLLVGGKVMGRSFAVPMARGGNEGFQGGWNTHLPPAITDIPAAAPADLHESKAMDG